MLESKSIVDIVSSPNLNFNLLSPFPDEDPPELSVPWVGKTTFDLMRPQPKAGFEWVKDGSHDPFRKIYHAD